LICDVVVSACVDVCSFRTAKNCHEILKISIMMFTLKGNDEGGTLSNALALP